MTRSRLVREAALRAGGPGPAGAAAGWRYLHGGSQRRLSLRATLPQFIAMENEHRSLILAALRQARAARASDRRAAARYWPVRQPGTGHGYTPPDMAAARPDEYDSDVDPGASHSSSRLRLALAGRDNPSGLPIEATAVVLATEAHASARLVDGFDRTSRLNSARFPARPR